MEECVASDNPLAEDRMTRREFHRLALAAGVCLLAPGAGVAGASEPFSFVHPGLLHTAADLDRMRKGVQQKRSPIVEGFERLREHPFSSLGYAPQSFASEIGRNPSVNFPAFDNDANAAYQCSLMAAITGDKRYAAIARAIVLGWSGSLRSVSGADAVLMAGLGPFKLINAAEILRATGELDASGAAQCARMLRRAILPAIIDFAPFANGNWDTAAIKTMLAMAVFCEDRALFERALVYYLHGDGDGRLTHYIYENGECQESGRDQQHTQLGLAHMGEACEIAWHQGLDLYGAEGNRLLRAFEYTAAYNLGGEVEFHPDLDRTGKYRHQVISPRGQLRPVYEQIFAHYHVRRGLPAPALEKAVAKLRPEGAGPGADQTGFGTLLYALEPDDAQQKASPAAPGAVYAEMKDGAAELSWLTPRNSGGCSVERAEANGAFRRVKTGIDAGKFRDNAAKPGRHYRYCIANQSAGAHELLSGVVEVFTSLPPGWNDAVLGNPSLPGNVQFDGKVLTIHAAGAGLMGPSDEGHFVGTAPEGGKPRHDLVAGSITARFVPQTASQVAMFGLACRKGLSANAPCVALVVLPAAGDQERHGWHIRLLARDGEGNVKTEFDFPLGQSAGGYGRLQQPLWFRLQRKQSFIHAQFSTDGALWKDAGQTAGMEDGVMGMIASSGIPGVDTAVCFDSVVVSL
jgi:hypothetical protein